MKQIDAHALSDSPIHNLKFIRCLEYFEGPLTSEYTDGRDQYIYWWHDCDKVSNRWVVFRTDSKCAEVLAESNDFTLKDVLNQYCYDDMVYVVDIGSGGSKTVYYIGKDSVVNGTI